MLKLKKIAFDEIHSPDQELNRFNRSTLMKKEEVPEAFSSFSYFFKDRGMGNKCYKR